MKWGADVTLQANTSLISTAQLNATANFKKYEKDLPNELRFVYNSQEYQENTFLSWIPTIIYIVMMIVIASIFFKVLSSGGGAGQALDFNKSKARRIDDSKVRFKDVAGCDEEKAEMMEIVDYLRNPKDIQNVALNYLKVSC